MIEDTHTLVKEQIGQKGKTVKRRQIGQPVPLINYADKATQRLQKRYYQLIQQGEPKNVAIAAVARELAGFIWGIETGTLA